MTLYTFYIDEIFNNIIPNISQLRDEINSALSGLVGISQKDNIVNIEFNPSLDDVSILENILTAHVPNFNPPKNNFFTYVPRKNCISSSVYERLGGPFKYGGSQTVGPINYIEISAYKDPDVTSYSLRIYDVINNLIIAERNGLTNLTETFIDLGAISNVPTESTTLELHVKKDDDSGSQIYVEQIVVYINN